MLLNNSVCKTPVICKTPIINANLEKKLGQEFVGIFPASYFDLPAFFFLRMLNNLYIFYMNTQ